MNVYIYRFLIETGKGKDRSIGLLRHSTAFRGVLPFKEVRTANDTLIERSRWIFLNRLTEFIKLNIRYLAI